MKINGKNKLLFLGIVLMLLASYRFAITNTLDARKESQRLEQQKDQVGNIPKTMAALRQKESYYDSILKKLDIGDTSVQNNLLRTINEEAKVRNVKVIDLNEPHVEIEDNNRRITYSFSLSGSYTGILKTIHTIERKGNFGEIVHMDFEKRKNHRTGRSSLEAIVFVQQVK